MVSFSHWRLWNAERITRSHVFRYLSLHCMKNLSWYVYRERQYLVLPGSLRWCLPQTNAFSLGVWGNCDVSYSWREHSRVSWSRAWKVCHDLRSTRFTLSFVPEMSTFLQNDRDDFGLSTFLQNDGDYFGLSTFLRNDRGDLGLACRCVESRNVSWSLAWMACSRTYSILSSPSTFAQCECCCIRYWGKKSGRLEEGGTMEWWLSKGIGNGFSARCVDALESTRKVLSLDFVLLLLLPLILGVQIGWLRRREKRGIFFWSRDIGDSLLIMCASYFNPAYRRVHSFVPS